MSNSSLSLSHSLSVTVLHPKTLASLQASIQVSIKLALLKPGGLALTFHLHPGWNPEKKIQKSTLAKNYDLVHWKVFAVMSINQQYVTWYKKRSHCLLITLNKPDVLPHMYHTRICVLCSGDALYQSCGSWGRPRAWRHRPGTPINQQQITVH